MDTSIIISLILGGASIISSICFGVIPGIRKNKIENLEKKVRKMAEDIDFFYEVEHRLIDQIVALSGGNSKSTKESVRKEVRLEKGRPLSDYANPSRIAQELNK